MCKEIIKKDCINWAFEWEKINGKFPSNRDWLVNKNKAPINKDGISKLFGSYESFKKSCNRGSDSDKILKNKAKDWAINFKQITGKFPGQIDWKNSKDNSRPFSATKLMKLFSNYNDFRVFCDEPITIRTKNSIPTIKDLKNNCYINEDCWIYKNNNEYNQISIKGKYILIHQYVFYNLLNNEKYENYTIDHICRNKGCINPDHLRLASYKEQAKNRSKPHNICKNNTKRPRNLSLEETIKFFIESSNIDKKTNCYIPIILPNKKDNYCRVKHNNKTYLLHKAVRIYHQNNYITKKLYETDDKLTRHICHNRSCCNPDHLKSGNYSENAIDTYLDNYHKKQKLSSSTVIEIKNMFNNYKENNVLKQDETIALQYGVSRSTITSIRLGRSWSHIKINKEQYD